MTGPLDPWAVGMVRALTRDPGQVEHLVGGIRRSPRRGRSGRWQPTIRVRYNDGRCPSFVAGQVDYRDRDEALGAALDIIDAAAEAEGGAEA